jgi:hypothetical protein
MAVKNQQVDLNTQASPCLVPDHGPTERIDGKDGMRDGRKRILRLAERLR